MHFVPVVKPVALINVPRFDPRSCGELLDHTQIKRACRSQRRQPVTLVLDAVRSCLSELWKNKSSPQNVPRFDPKDLGVINVLKKYVPRDHGGLGPRVAGR